MANEPLARTSLSVRRGGSRVPDGALSARDLASRTLSHFAKNDCLMTRIDTPVPNRRATVLDCTSGVFKKP